MWFIRRLEKEETKMQIEQSKARILADCIEGMAADAEDKGKESFGIHLSLDDAHMITRALSTAPTVNVVPVVRCRECRHYAASGATTSFCIHPGGMKFTSDSDYCSRGQRRDQSADVRNMGQFAGSGKTGGPNDADQH